MQIYQNRHHQFDTVIIKAFQFDGTYQQLRTNLDPKIVARLFKYQCQYHNHNYPYNNQINCHLGQTNRIQTLLINPHQPIPGHLQFGDYILIGATDLLSENIETQDEASFHQEWRLISNDQKKSHHRVI